MTTNIYNNNLQSILEEHGLSQRQLADVAGLGLETIGRTCRRINGPKQETKQAITIGINRLLKDRDIKKTYTVEDIFSDANFGKK